MVLKSRFIKWRFQHFNQTFTCAVYVFRNVHLAERVKAITLLTISVFCGARTTPTLKHARVVHCVGVDVPMGNAPVDATAHVVRPVEEVAVHVQVKAATCHVNLELARVQRPLGDKRDLCGATPHLQHPRRLVGRPGLGANC